MAKSVGDTFNEIIKLSEQTMALMEVFDKSDPDAQEEVLSAYFTKALRTIKPDGEVTIGAVRTAEMLIGLGGEKAVGLFGEGLDHENLDVRMLCGDALMHLGEEGIDAIMPAVEAVLKREGAGAEEMPFILAELEDPAVPETVVRFLKARNPHVVAAALEAIADVGDDSSIDSIKPLLNDAREVEIDDSIEGESTTTIGQLAKEARDMLSKKD